MVIGHQSKSCRYLLQGDVLSGYIQPSSIYHVIVVNGSECRVDVRVILAGGLVDRV